LHIFASDQIKEERDKKKAFVSFLATFEQLSLQKATFDFFWSTFLKNFGRLWEISSNLWQALVKMTQLLPNLATVIKE